jgi:hypothetical protein
MFISGAAHCALQLYDRLHRAAVAPWMEQFGYSLPSNPSLCVSAVAQQNLLASSLTR